MCVFADKQRFESSIRLCNSSCSSFHICIETTSSLYIVYSLHPPCLYHEPNFLHHLHQTAYAKSLKFAIDASRLNHLSSRYLPKRSLVQSSSTQLYCDTWSHHSHTMSPPVRHQPKRRSESSSDRPRSSSSENDGEIQLAGRMTYNQFPIYANRKHPDRTRVFSCLTRRISVLTTLM